MGFSSYEKRCSFLLLEYSSGVVISEEIEIDGFLLTVREHFEIKKKKGTKIFLVNTHFLNGKIILNFLNLF